MRKIQEDVAASFAAVTWLFIEWKVIGKPKLIGLMTGTDGLIHGGIRFFFVEFGAVVFAAVYAFAISYVLLKLINYITPVVVKDEVQNFGLATELHGEDAYNNN